MEKNDIFRVLDEGLLRKGWKCTDLYRAMEEKGYDVNLRTLQRYRSQATKPNFKTAKQILECLDVEATDNEVQELLDNSERSEGYQFSDLRYLERGIRIRISRMSDTLDNEGSILLALKDRIAATQNLDKPNFNRYITMLIKKDIDEHILPTVRKRKTEE